VRLPTKVIVVSPAMKLSVVMSDVVFGCLSACQPGLTLRRDDREYVDNSAHVSAERAG